LHEWKNRKVVVVGLARQGKALARYLAGQGAYVFVSDLKSAPALEAELEEMRELPISYVLGEHPLELLDEADAVFLSGGVPADIQLALEARMRGVPISNDSQLFLDLCAAPVIGITGSAGKSTTTELVGRMAAHDLAGDARQAWVGGNIGRPMLEDLQQIQENDWAIIELSSFQLEIMSSSPHIAAVLNLTPNHLDRHKTMEAYADAKSRILAFQEVDDIAILNREDPGSWDLRQFVKGRLISFGIDEAGVEQGTFLRSEQLWLREFDKDFPICTADSISLRGKHNLENVLAACAIAAGTGFSLNSMLAGISGYTGIEHRLEFIRNVRGADWYNDSIATSPERAIAAMNSFAGPIVLLAGGRDKELPWEDFARVVAEKVDHLILFGEARDKIAHVVVEQHAEKSLDSIHQAETLSAAVDLAIGIVEEGDVVLLAPGGTSFDQYVDFAERGDEFRFLVESIT
jgi:UDP-N-acetylmuramoylalanine--D-glutamate ligase